MSRVQSPVSKAIALTLMLSACRQIPRPNASLPSSHGVTRGIAVREVPPMLSSMTRSGSDTPYEFHSGRAQLASGTECTFVHRFRGEQEQGSIRWSEQMLPDPVSHVHVRPEGMYIVTQHGQVLFSTGCLAPITSLSLVEPAQLLDRATHTPGFSTSTPLSVLVRDGEETRIQIVRPDQSVVTVTPPGGLPVVSYGLIEPTSVLAVLEGGTAVFSADAGAHWKEFPRTAGLFMNVRSEGDALVLETLLGQLFEVSRTGELSQRVVDPRELGSGRSSWETDGSDEQSESSWELLKSLISQRPDVAASWFNVVHTHAPSNIENSYLWMLRPGGSEVLLVDERAPHRVQVFPGIEGDSSCHLHKQGVNVLRACGDRLSELHPDGTQRALPDRWLREEDVPIVSTNGVWSIDTSACGAASTSESNAAAPNEDDDPGVNRETKWCARSAANPDGKRLLLESDEKPIAALGNRLLVESREGQDTDTAYEWYNLDTDVRDPVLRDDELPVLSPQASDDDADEEAEPMRWDFNLVEIADGSFLLEASTMRRGEELRVWSLTRDGQAVRLRLPELDEEARKYLSSVNLMFGSPRRGFLTAINGSLYVTQDGGMHWTSLGVMPHAPMQSTFKESMQGCDLEGCVFNVGRTGLRVRYDVTRTELESALAALALNRSGSPVERETPLLINVESATDPRQIALTCTGLPADRESSRSRSVQLPHVGARTPWERENLSRGGVWFDFQRRTSPRGENMYQLRTLSSDESGEYTLPTQTWTEPASTRSIPFAANRRGTVVLEVDEQRTASLRIPGTSMRAPVDRETMATAWMFVPIPLNSTLTVFPFSRGAALLRHDTLDFRLIALPLRDAPQQSSLGTYWKGGFRFPTTTRNDATVGFYLNNAGALSILAHSQLVGESSWIRLPFDLSRSADKVPTLNPNSLPLCASPRAPSSATWFVRMHSISIDPHRYTGLAVIDDGPTPCLRALRFTLEPGGDTPVPTLTLRAQHGTLLGTTRDAAGTPGGPLRCTVVPPPSQPVGALSGAHSG